MRLPEYFASHRISKVLHAGGLTESSLSCGKGHGRSEGGWLTHNIRIQWHAVLWDCNWDAFLIPEWNTKGAERVEGQSGIMAVSCQIATMQWSEADRQSMCLAIWYYICSTECSKYRGPNWSAYATYICPTQSL